MHFMTISTHFTPPKNIFIAQKYVYMLGKYMIEENKVTHLILVKLMECQSFANGLEVSWVPILGVCHKLNKNVY